MLQLFIKGIHREHSHYTTPGHLQWISPYLLNRYSVDIYFISLFVPCCKYIWVLTYQQGSSYLTEGDSWLIPAGWRSELSGSPKFNYKSCGKGNFEAHYCCCCVKCCCVKTISSLLALSHYTIKPHQESCSPLLQSSSHESSSASASSWWRGGECQSNVRCTLPCPATTPHTQFSQIYF